MAQKNGKGIPKGDNGKSKAERQSHVEGVMETRKPLSRLDALGQPSDCGEELGEVNKAQLTEDLRSRVNLTHCDPRKQAKWKHPFQGCMSQTPPPATCHLPPATCKAKSRS